MQTIINNDAILLAVYENPNIGTLALFKKVNPDATYESFVNKLLRLKNTSFLSRTETRARGKFSDHKWNLTDKGKARIKHLKLDEASRRNSRYDSVTE